MVAVRRSGNEDHLALLMGDIGFVSAPKPGVWACYSNQENARFPKPLNPYINPKP